MEPISDNISVLFFNSPPDCPFVSSVQIFTTYLSNDLRPLVAFLIRGCTFFLRYPYRAGYIPFYFRKFVRRILKIYLVSAVLQISNSQLLSIKRKEFLFIYYSASILLGLLSPEG